jgi:hypothetical protein
MPRPTQGKSAHWKVEELATMAAGVEGIPQRKFPDSSLQRKMENDEQYS